MLPAASHTPYVDGVPIFSLGYTELLEIAEYYSLLESQNGADPLEMFFPDHMIEDFKVKVQRRKRGVGITPLVEFGQPDVFLADEDYDEMEVTPAAIRESAKISQITINHLRQFGTRNEKAGLSEIARLTQRLVERRTNLIRIFRAKMMLGQLSYTDPRTGSSINVSANFHPANLITLPPTEHFTDPSVDVIQLMLRHVYELRILGKAEPTHVLMSPHMQFVLQNHPVVRANMGYYLPGYGATNPTGVAGANEQVGYQMGRSMFQGYATLTNGKLTSIAGLEVVIVDALFEDPAANFAVKEVWPKNKIAIVCRNRGSSQLGRTTHTLGENPDMRPGMFMVVSQDPPQPPMAPGGRLMQIGDNLLPNFLQPNWVRIMEVSTEAEVDALINTDLMTLTVPSYDQGQLN